MTFRNRLKFLFFLLIISFLNSIAFAGGFKLKATDRWMIYIGGYVGHYNADFQNGANYFQSGNGGNQSFNNDAFQQGFLGGVQTGIQYHFLSPYYVGLMLSYMWDGNKAEVSNQIDNAVGGNNAPFPITFKFRITNNFDIAPLFGIDITPYTHLYTKIGASLASLTNNIVVAAGKRVFSPSVTFQAMQHKDIWGWIVGLGVVHDFNQRLNLFAEYDYYSYGRHDLTSYNKISPLQTVVNHLTQNVRSQSSAIKIGLNIKLTDSMYLPNPFRTITSPWAIYLGIFTGYYGADFRYGANYATNRSLLNVPSNTVFNNDALQNGVLGGAQIGIQYHFLSPYYIGLLFDGMSNANKAWLSNSPDNAISASTNGVTITHNFRINNSFDIVPLFGLDITYYTHFYVKAGASYASLIHNLFITQNRRVPFPMTSFQVSQDKNILGYVVGVGLSHDFNKWLNFFAEYDYYDYGFTNLNSENNITPNIPAGRSDILMQHVHVNASSVRLGLNVKLIDNSFGATASHSMGHENTWMFYVGGFRGYYGVDYAYGGNYFSANAGFAAPLSYIYNDSTTQRGILGGVQAGLDYHFQSPYFLGLVTAYGLNADKSRLVVQYIDARTGTPPLGADLNQRFRITSNVDITPVFGMDITQKTDLYVKAGGSYADFNQEILLTKASGSFSASAINDVKQSKGLWGWIVGMGLSYDINKRLNIFGEYDYYAYGNFNLSSYTFLRKDLLTQHVGIYANAFHIGLNVMF